MSKRKFLVDIDFNKNQALNMVLHNNPGSLTTTASGQTYYDTVDHTVYTYAPQNPNSVAGWLNLGSTGITNLTWTASTSTIHSSSGTNAILTLADVTNPGLLSTAHWNYLENPSMANMTGTKAQFNTALSDGSFLFTGDADNYVSWSLWADGTNRGAIVKDEKIDFVGGTGLVMVYTTTNDNTVTFNVDYAGTDNVINSATDLEGVAIAVDDTIIYHDATDNNVKKGLVSDLPYTNNAGDITRVNITAGDGLTGTVDTTTGDHTQTINAVGGVGIVASADSLDLDFSELTDMTASIAGTTEFIIQDGTTESRKAASEISLSFFNNDSGWTSNAGTVTEVTVGTGLAVTNGTTIPDVTLSLNSLSEKTGLLVGTDRLVGLTSTTHWGETINQIPLSIFNNDSSWTSNLGTVTSVGITGADFDITNTPITTSGDIGLSIKADAVTNAKLANMAANTIKGNATAGSANPTDIAMVANSVLLRAGGNIEDFIVTINTVLGRVGGNIQNLAIDSDLTTVSAADDTLASAKAIKTYVDDAVTGALVYQGGYDALANSPDLDVSPDSGITQGWTYTVTVSGTFFTTAVAVGDLLIAETDSPTVEADWTIVNKAIPDIVDATTTVKGIVRLATIPETNTGTSAIIAVTPDGLDGWTGSAQLTTLGTISAGTWGSTATNLVAETQIDFIDSVTNNATNLKHGYLPKLSNVATQYLNGQGGWTTPPNTNQLTTFTLTADSGTPQTIAHSNTMDIAGGTVISTVVSATDTVTINHDSVTRAVNGATAVSPAHGATFTVIDSVTSSTEGHITGVNVKTVTLPSNDGTVKKFAQDLTGTTTTHVVTHNLGTRDIVAGVYETASTYDEVECVVQRTSINTTTFIFNVAPTSGEYRAVITG